MLTGSAWFSFLDRSAGLQAFGRGLGDRLESLAYDPCLAAAMDREHFHELKDLAGEWIRKHDPHFEQKR
jgi:hypothetical protein